MDRTTTGNRRLLAALVAGAGVIHLAMVPSHMDEWAVEGTAFALVGWAQIAVAVALLVQPSRALELWTAAGSAVLVGLWAVSRVTGLPVGPNSGHAEAAGFVDVVAVALEVAFIVIVVALPRFQPRTALVTVVLPLAVVGLATAAIVSPSARDHSHGGDAAHGHTDGAAHDDHTAATNASDATSASAASASAASASSASASASGHAHASGTADTTSLAAGHTHPDDFKPYLPMDVATFKLLGEQLTVVRELTLRYPTVGDAEAAGFRRRGSFVPGQGAHYFPPPGVLARGATPIERPISWLYAGTAPTSPVVGVMYSFVDFAGPNDRFHYHDNVCLGPTEADGTSKTLSESEPITAAQCTAMGGISFLPRAGPLMHVWAVPGWESPIGVFSHDNPLVVCTDGQQPSEVTQGKGGCQGLA